jgi:hypothetical protein
VAVPYLQAFSIVSCAAMMQRSEKALDNPGIEDNSFKVAKKATAEFYRQHILPQAIGYADMVSRGAAAVTNYDPALL